MTKTDIATLSAEQLVGRYVALLLTQYDLRDRLTADGRYDLAAWKRLSRQADAAAAALERREGGLARLLPLLGHDNPNVRYTAALHLVHRDPRPTLPVFEEIARATETPALEGDVVAVLRKMSAQRWIPDRLMSGERRGISETPRSELGTLPIPVLLDRYTALLLWQYAVRDCHDVEGRPDVGPWNRLADQIEALEHALKSWGEEGIDALLALTHHANPNVRFAAAVHCLRRRTAAVLPVLQQMAETNDFAETRIDPERALSLWREGKWVVD